MAIIKADFLGTPYDVIKDLYENRHLVNVPDFECMPHKVKTLWDEMQEKIDKLETELAKFHTFMAVLEKSKEEDPELWI